MKHLFATIFLLGGLYTIPTPVVAGKWVDGQYAKSITNVLTIEHRKQCTGLIEPDTLMRDNNRQTLRCHYGAETNIQAIHQRV